MSTMKRLRLFLDDARPTPEGWVRAFWPTEVIAWLETGTVKAVSLDHDLGHDARGTGYSPRHSDMTVLAVEITKKSTGAWIEGVLTRVAQQAGEPVQILSDHGSDVRKGVSLFCQSRPQCVETYDISHATANALKAHWRHDTRQALSAALRQTLIAQHAPPFERLEDDAFWRLARFLHAFEWVLTYRTLLPPWAHTLAVSTTIQTELKTHGLSRHSAQTLKAKLDAQAPLPPPVADFQARRLEQVQRKADQRPPGVTWMASSDIIESVLGHYKRFTERGPLKEIGKLVLTIPAFLTDLTAPLVREAMESVRLLDVEQWVDAHLGDSMLKRRRQALKPTPLPTPQLALKPT